MNPVTGAGASDKGQPENQRGAEPPQHEAAPGAHSEPIGSNERVLAVLEAMGEELPEESAQPTGGKANGEKIPGTAGIPAGQNGSGGRAEEAPGAQGSEPQGGQAQAGDEEEVDAETRQQLPESIIKMLDKRRHQRNAARDETKAERKAREAAEAERDQLREQLKSTKQVRVNPTEENPLADVNDMNELAKARTRYDELVEFHTLNPHGALVVQNAEGRRLAITKDAMGRPERELEEGEKVVRDISERAGKKELLESQRILRDYVPARAAFLEQSSQLNDAAKVLYPEIFDEESPEGKAAAAMEERGLFANYPDQKLWIGRALRRFAEEQQELAELAKANGTGKGNGNADRAPDAVKPFLTRQPKIAPTLPQPRGGGAGAKPAKNVDEAVNRVVETNEDPEAVGDLIGTLRNSQGQRAVTV